MELLTWFAAVVALASAMKEPSLDDRWKQFKLKYNKHFADNEMELHRRATWEDNVKFIDKHNSEHEHGLHTYTLAENRFADMTQEEFRAKMTTCLLPPENSVRRVQAPASHYVKFGAINATVDWVKNGYVTSVKNQGECGSCYAFSAVGSLEGQLKNKTGSLIDLSPQQLVDCSHSYGNDGCAGGLMPNCFDYVKDKGLSTLKQYPYTSVKGQEEKCKRRHQTSACVGKRLDSDKNCVRLTSYTVLPKGDESTLKYAVALVGPISIAVDASQTTFRFYHQGVYADRDCSSVALDHGVLAVGYGELNGTKYWKVKNSWGVGWGLQGYIYIARDDNNMCGVATTASYPILI